MDDDDDNSSSSALDYDFDRALPERMPELPDGMTSLEEWTDMRRETLPGLADDPLTATFTDLDLAPARANLPLEFDESYWAV
ncbi:MAG: hypothetical protein JWR36_559 [Glaciihabitans sp.]|jgi:hypothetical protein|nr:hypothetical protein [Glaciihabitans sp.]MDQ1572184.1 hypothetical protein [Actinomycetota bacterium]